MLPMLGGINDFSGAVRDGVLFLSFTVPQKNKDGSEIKDLAGFKVFKACGSCAGTFEPFRDISFEEAKGYTIARGRLYIYDDDVTNGFDYAYRVYPYTMRGTHGDASNTFSIKWVRPPEVPKNVVVSVNDGRVELSWPKEDGYLYNIYRQEGDVYQLFALNQSPIAAGPYIDMGVKNGTKYRYEVRKVKILEGLPREGEGMKIDAVPVDKTPPAVPVLVRAVKTDNGVSVMWKENIEKDLAGYNVFRIVLGKKEKVNKDLVKGNSFVDQAIPDYRYASYCVSAVDAVGNESELSLESIVILKE